MHVSRLLSLNTVCGMKAACLIGCRGTGSLSTLAGGLLQGVLVLMAWKSLQSHRLGHLNGGPALVLVALSTPAQRVSNSASVQVRAKAPEKGPARRSVWDPRTPSHRCAPLNCAVT